jgi:rod shape-determining protein MreB
VDKLMRCRYISIIIPKDIKKLKEAKMANKGNGKEGKINVGIDLGTSNLRIYVEGRGTVYNEPSIIAIDKATGKVVSVGNDAAALLDKTHDKVEVKKPIHGGVITDIELVRQIIVFTIEKLLASGFENINRLMLCMPTEITETEKTALETLGNELGVQDTRIEEEIKASAIGAGINIYKLLGHFVIDIGGGTTDFGVISLGDVVLSRSVKTAGDFFDKQLSHYVKERYNLEIGPQTEQLKISLASLTGDLPVNEEGKCAYFRNKRARSGFRLAPHGSY